MDSEGSTETPESMNSPAGQADDMAPFGAMDFLSVVEGHPDGLVVVDSSGIVQYLNSVAENALGRSRNEIVGSPFGYPVLDQERALLEISTPSGAIVHLEARAKEMEWSGQSYCLVALREKGRTEEAWSGYEPPPRRDPLTGLLTQLYFSERARQVLAHAADQGHRAALCILDIDNFHLLNETMGYGIADMILQELAGRLTENFGEVDVIGRYSGDEFLILVSDAGGDKELAEIQQKMCELAQAPFSIDGNEVNLTYTIGTSVFPDDAKDNSALFQQGEIALNHAKRQGVRIARYDASMDETTSIRRKVANGLQRAIKEKEFALDYQPIVSVRSGGIVAAEALLRWQHPEEGIIPPNRFVPVAEEIGMMPGVGRFVADETCRQIKSWQADGLPVVPVAVNLSSNQLEEGAFADDFLAAASRHGVDPRLIAVEVTESLLMKSRTTAVKILEHLRKNGVQVYLDDFGTGYSSLSHLKYLPVDFLKIDRSFVDDLVTNPDDAAISVAVISVAHRLGLEVVAEGVETVAQLEFLRKRNCDFIQGYHFSRPVDGESFAGLLEEGKCFEVTQERSERTLLLVDDEPHVINSLRRALRMDGYKIYASTLPFEALEILATHEIDVVISDFRMPDMEGDEFLRRVRSLHPSTVRILLTGFTQVEAAISVINNGAAYKFLAKPWDTNELREAVRDAFAYHETCSQAEKSTTLMDDILAGTRLRWSSAFSVDVEAIDQENEKAFALHNDLSDEVWSDGVAPLADSIVTQLTELMRAHFATEESWLETINYPELGRHRDHHERFFEKLTSLCNRPNIPERALAADLLAFFRTWLVSHLQQEDMAYRDFALKQKNECLPNAEH